ncbi:stage III sporulation protein AE [Clostridium massiliamazoniense]|uniref:stage III sporulation protein AE n=1 Tax=Clostridium massiliamazoniense TaxID=1347366 RepID=UPI0006D8002C|nr:stage III sporulation protein AE [Clostridium massiliamazoniense]
MFKKIINLILISFLILNFNASRVEANEKERQNNKQVEEQSEELNKAKEDIENNSTIEEFYNYVNGLNLDSELIGDISVKEYVQNFLANGEGTISFGAVVKTLINYSLREINVTIKLLMSVLIIAIIGALMKNLQDAFKNNSLSNVAFFACYSVMMMLLTSSFLVALGIAKDVLQNLMDFMAVMMPVLVFLIGTAGGAVTALTLDPIVLMLVSLTPQIYMYVIFPLILGYFVLQFVNNISETYKIDKLCKLIKQIAMWLQGGVLTIFVALIAIRGITSSTIDAVTLKTAKFAIDNFIPIVGKAFSDAISTIAGYSLLLKSAISSVGLIVVIGILVYPLIKLIVMIFSYRIVAALVEPVADKRMVNSISSVGDSMTMLFSAVLSVSVIFFIVIAIMASAGKFIVGG